MIKRGLKRFGWVAISYALVWFGVIQENAGAANLFIFMVWVSFASVLICIWSTESIERLKQKGTPLPQPISRILNLGMLIILVWHGWWVVSFIYTTTWVLCEGIYYKPKEGSNE